jgi:hypothetical protein
MSKIIALSGFKGSGKDICADFLVKNHGFKRVSFADALKDMVASEFGITRSWLDDPSRKEFPIHWLPVESKDEFTKMIHTFMVREFKTFKNFSPDPGYVRVENGKLESFIHDRWEQLYQTPRSLAILKGSVNRSVKSDYWVRKAIEDINSVDGKYVISDLRYRSEIDQLKEAFGEVLTTVRIERFDSSPSSDPSELDLNDSKFDHYLNNKKTKEEVFAQLKEILDKL